MPLDPSAAWDSTVRDLTAWHDCADRGAAERALRFLEPRLRAMLPAPAARRWPGQQIDEVLSAFMVRLLERRLPDDAANAPQAYLRTTFRRWCIDHERKRRRDPSEPWEEDIEVETSAGDPNEKLRLGRALDALDALDMSDRVAIKLVDAPYALTHAELCWLALRSQTSADRIAAQLQECADVYAITFVFDPGPAPETAQGRRDRMERFRQRRGRARRQLLQNIGGEP